MFDQIKKPLAAQNFYRLPFKPGTKILTRDTLEKHSWYRYLTNYDLSISTTKLSFSKELLTMGIVLNKELQKRVYLKITPSALLVSCSVDTNESYLSHYAYYLLYDLTDLFGEYDFENYYWPGFFDQQTGKSKYLKIPKTKGTIFISPNLAYFGLYKPGTKLPNISANKLAKTKIIPVPKDVPAQAGNKILSFCFADSHNSWRQCDHYPFLIPYTATLNKNKTAVRSFKTFITEQTNVTGIDLTEQQQRLMEICFAMKKIAHTFNIQFIEDPQEVEEKQKENERNFNSLFELWQQAIPLLTGRLYTYYYYTQGMHNVKSMPSKSSMIPCDFSNEIPEICFSWKDKGEYYKLVLRIRFGRKIHNTYSFFNTDFFVQRSVLVKDYVLLNSLMDCELINFFQKRHYQFLILKDHYTGDCKYFVDQLRTAYKFIKQ